MLPEYHGSRRGESRLSRQRQGSRYSAHLGVLIAVPSCLTCLAARRLKSARGIVQICNCIVPVPPAKKYSEITYPAIRMRKEGLMRSPTSFDDLSTNKGDIKSALAGIGIWSG
jgi:hypothetical protein